MEQLSGSIALSTYQAGKVAMIGWDGRSVSLVMREFDKPLGMTTGHTEQEQKENDPPNRIVLATREDVCFFGSAPLLARDYQQDRPGRYDALYLPRATYHTGDLATHDVTLVGDDVYLVATRFSCVARLSREFNFEPVWKPSFISELAPEDRCHLNGLAMVQGRPKYATALGRTNEPGGWRQRKKDGGIVLDIQTDEIVADGLSMPHTPRWHDGRLWLLDSGRGRLLRLDPASGEQETICELPGYLRGLCFVGPWVVVGMCKIREKHIFGGLPVQEKHKELRCGAAVVDTRTGEMVGMFEFTSGCEELYDICLLPGATRPTIVNRGRAESKQAFSGRETSFWVRGEGDRSA